MIEYNFLLLYFLGIYSLGISFSIVFISIVLSVVPEKNMFQIDISNNGIPLPAGMDKNRFGLLGEKAGVTGRTGRGGYVVKSIVEHYHGDYDVFMDGDNTVVRILLPISKDSFEYEQI